MIILKILGIILFSILSVAGITQRNTPGCENNIFLGFFSLLVVIFLFFSISHSKKKQKEKARAQAELNIQEKNRAEDKKRKLIAIDSLSLIPVDSPTLLLKESEVAYIEQSATLIVTKNKMVGTTGRGSGISMKVAKGVYIRTSGSGSKKIYSDVTTKFNGILSITNCRISFMQTQCAFEIPLHKLTNIISSNTAITLQSGSKSYNLLIKDADIIEYLIRRLCKN